MKHLSKLVRKASRAYPFASLRSQKKNTITALLRSGIDVSQVVDVGVRECTADLLGLFPKVQHLLFEPAAEFHPLIENNYKNISHVLNACALSSESGSAYLIKTALENDDVISHTRISDTAHGLPGENVVGVDEIEIRTLDSFTGAVLMNCLVKIDVDGMELPIIKGASNTIRLASIVVIEVTSLTLVERLAAVEKLGFRLVDFVDRVRYGLALHQCDAVFVREDLINDSIVPVMSPFDSAKWLPLP